ncbi:FIG004853: possible toxin to DivIC [uncultured Rubrobacteraceae bacterium]|uniref:FIG004853: possible toxin to DivIC n=1 Tax=uncultured Rubrobacteraceae bacterium TaxID=349277 RepID=A0A6J4QB17_9ACTN|nr:FIG004853: possible toxin to DivIC [uncultured Rubrobacteraceae bacterium]
MNDRETVALQLGREPAPFRVAARCPAGLPSVIENERRREMPTTFWITCPSLQAAISRVEAAGGVRAAQEEIGAEAVDATHAEHLARYGVRVAGVGGSEGEIVGRIKCLHAFTALHLASALPNPVAEWTFARLEEIPYPDPIRCPGCVERLERTS